MTHPAPGLRWLGGNRFVFGVPARDLEPEDLDRLVYRAVQIAPGQAGYTAAYRERRASLLGSGLYGEPSPSTTAATADAAADRPDTPPDAEPGATAGSTGAPGAPDDPAPADPAELDVAAPAAEG